MAHSAYTVATVAVMDMHDNIDGPEKVNIYLRALYGLRATCPGVQRSINIIVSGYHHVPVMTASSGQDMSIPQATQPLPAFPLDQQIAYTANGLASLDEIPFGELDAFAIDWSNIATDASQYPMQSADQTTALQV
jgi:hypothetical protein